ncbi:Lrp/AsnC family transcriptional regulator [Amycolatopsis pithecellobii]|uniref:AsnC family transcriptional regulator n=1 Tax=Amycolatopsis pithecellobii TaxID=664692 RepID=A0A6N7YWT7_9PSEU|nr:AsnC family transcriptional regulator [Amycolatopsis pithecellobii]MTD52799.1 AsnC family transcriptional regulator [Amycolatopsis pithecellobii]
MEKDSVTLDHVDRKLLHALHVDARASFARIGDVLGVSDRTVARRYVRLRERKVINLVGITDSSRLDGAEWVVRMQCKPGSAVQVADALARRDDTRWVSLLSGGTEISASVRAWSARERPVPFVTNPTAATAETGFYEQVRCGPCPPTFGRISNEPILQRLHRTAPVVSVTAHSVLHVFSTTRHGFEGPGSLTRHQIAALQPAYDAGAGTLADDDRPLLEALAVDGRAPYPALAVATGWSESTVARRIHALRAADLLRFDLDVNAAALGYHAEARLWASVPPAHLADTGAAVATHPEVTFCAATTGPANLLISTVCRDSRDLYRYLTERLGALPQIHEVQTAPVIRVVKRAGRRPSAIGAAHG